MLSLRMDKALSVTPITRQKVGAGERRAEIPRVNEVISTSSGADCADVNAACAIDI